MIGCISSGGIGEEHMVWTTEEIPCETGVFVSEQQSPIIVLVSPIRVRCLLQRVGSPPAL